MKNALDFNINYNRLEGLNFIQRFATAYTFLESSAEAPDIHGCCVGCNGDCKKDRAAEQRCKFFFLFNTMCGNSALRCRFDGRPTEMQRLIGDTREEGNGCGSDFTIDFLFGYTGYEYRKVTGDFKAEIIAAIDAGKPVIAKLKSGKPRFHLISGYDGDAMVCPDFLVNWDENTNKPKESRPEEPPTYDELDALYIFGDKTTRRYTLIDGLYNIRRAMECNINERVWDGYLEQLGGDFVKASQQERLVRAQRLKDTVLYIYNICSFDGAFCTDGKPHSHYLHAELWNPDLVDLWNSVDAPHWVILNAGHRVGGFHGKLKKAAFISLRIRGMSAKICGTINELKDADRKLLEIIKQALAILEQQEKPHEKI